jgi:hypothetical protein
LQYACTKNEESKESKWDLNLSLEKPFKAMMKTTGGVLCSSSNERQNVMSLDINSSLISF